MKQSLLKLSCGIVSVACLCAASTTFAQSLAIDSLSGPITQNEINSFKAYMATQCPPPNGWTQCGGTVSHNTWADGAGGNILEAFGLMYDATGDITILTNMLHWTDTCVSQRNDLMSASLGGQRRMWTNGIAPVWCPEPPTNDYAGGENGDTKAHILYAALLILQNPSLWSQTVPDGDPFGYGATYLDRATTYVKMCDEANDGYDYIFILPNNTTGNPPLWPSGFHTMNANNIRAMMDGDFERSAQCHEILGDDPSRVAKYDAVVKADSGACISGMAGYHPSTVNGDPVYDWGYYPTDVYPAHTESVGHGAYDAIGIWRAYTRGAYGYSLATVKPFANAVIDVMNVSTNTYSGNVDGSGTTQNYMQQQWLLFSDMRAGIYDSIAQADLVSGRYKSSPYMTAQILWTKNRRLLEYAVAATPTSQTVNAGSGTSYTVSVTPLAGFTGTVGMSVSGLPSGATGSFNHGSVNLSTVSTFYTNVTLSVSTASSTPGGTYTLTITGTSGSVSHSTNVSLTVNAVSDFSISATPSSQSVQVGGSTSYTVNLGNINGFGGTISLSSSGLPSGAGASFNPSSLTAPGSSTMTVTTSGSTPAANSSLTITGTSGNLTHSTNVTLQVTDFSLSASPNSLTVTQGANGTSTITVNPINGFSGSVGLSASGLPNGVTASFNPSSTTSTSTLTLSASSTAATGPATVTVTGASGSLTHNTSINLTVNPASTNNFAGTYKLQNEASGLVLNNQGSLTNGSAITQWTSTTTSSNLDWTFIATSNGYYQINSSKSGRDAVVQSASTSAGAGIVQWSFGSSGDDQWKPVANGDGSYTFFNLHSGLVLADPGSSTNKTTQMDQETANGGSNQNWNLLKQ